MNALEEVVALQPVSLAGRHGLLLRQLEEALAFALQGHAYLAVPSQPLPLSLQLHQTLLQPLQLRLGQPLGILHAPELRVAQDAVISYEIHCLTLFLQCKGTKKFGV